MKVTYTNHHEVPVNVTVTPEFGGLMITAHYAEEHLQPEGQMIRDHSWTLHGVLHVSVHHIGLSGFDYVPDGNDMLAIEGETDFERALLVDGRLFCCNNQILALPGEEDVSLSGVK